jgi:transposase
VDASSKVCGPGKEREMGEGRRRREVPEAFEREAVERARTSGLTIIAVADELGLHETVLRRWSQRHGEPGMARRRAVGSSPADLAAENARLKRELDRARMERDMPQKRRRSSSKGPPDEVRVRR